MLQVLIKMKLKLYMQKIKSYLWRPISGNLTVNETT